MHMDTDEDEGVEVPMSPLIDCVFLLLIFFLVTTMMKKEQRDIDIDLPTSISALEVAPDDQKLVIGIDSAGALYVDGRPITRDRLYHRLADIAQSEPDKHIRLDCDQMTPFAGVVEILDLCQFRNLRNVGVRTYDDKYNR